MVNEHITYGASYLDSLCDISYCANLSMPCYNVQGVYGLSR
jgi:hypothetical protein